MTPFLLLEAVAHEDQVVLVDGASGRLDFAAMLAAQEAGHSTVTLLARLRGWSTSRSSPTAV